MKKIFITLIVVSMMLSLLTTVAFAAENTLVVLDFEGAEVGFVQSADDKKIDISRETATPLIGTGSLRLDMQQIPEAWDYVYYFLGEEGGYFASGAGYDGYVMRLKTDLTANATFKLMVDGSFEKGTHWGGRAEFGGGVMLLDMDGNDVTPENATDLAGAWNGFHMAAGFDGYVFLPFSGNLVGSIFDAALTNSYILGFVTPTWSDATVWIDQFGYYKGTDYAAIMEELSTSSETPAATPTTAPVDTEAPGDAGIILYVGLAAASSALLFKKIKK